jgi:hypothetical protein
MNHTANVRRAIEQEQQRNARRRIKTTDGFYGPLTGKTYDSLEAMHHYETREAMHRNVDPTDILLEGLSPEQIAALDQRVRQTEQVELERSAPSIDTATFLELHPEFADCDANSEELKRFLFARGQWNPEGTRWPTLYQLEDAFKTLKATGVLKFNQDELNRQAKEQAQERARQIQARGGVAAAAANTPTESEEELETMPLEEIRRRATVGGWLR